MSQTPSISLRELNRGVAAVQTQVVRDLWPSWNTSAPVNPFFRLEDVPLGHWPVVIRDDVGPTTAGIHRFEGTPVGVSPAAGDWTLSVSRVVLDLLVNPDGRRRLVGPAPDETGAVEYVAAVAAVGDQRFQYDIQGYPVSGFVFPAFYQGVVGPFDISGHIEQARQVVPGGHLIWWDSGTGRWWQQRWTTDDGPEQMSIEIDPGGDVERQHRHLEETATTTAEIDLRGSTGRRPSAATRRSARLSDHLNSLTSGHRSPNESPNR
ncbi:MAG: hypothetical protein ACR2QE_12890 [Acidimicrobiales bacterium]